VLGCGSDNKHLCGNVQTVVKRPVIFEVYSCGNLIYLREWDIDRKDQIDVRLQIDLTYHQYAHQLDVKRGN
jgi:hypothetical protein